MKSSKTKLWRSPWFWLVAVAVAGVVGFMLFSQTGQDWIEAVNDWAQGVMDAHPMLGVLVFFALSVASAVLAFVSSVMLVPAASEVWGKLLTFALLWAGWLTGSVITYAIGYYARGLLHRLVDRQDLARYEKIASKHMKLWAATILCLAVPSELPGYVFGALRYPFAKFIAAIGIAEAVYAFGVIVAGDSLTQAKPVGIRAEALPQAPHLSVAR
jgi:uncharacterized membrane protein YdjX (TVP38/TMEM64 family)